MAFGLSATAIAGLGSAALGAYSASKGSKQSGSQTTTNQASLDPRADKMLYGADGSGGLLDRYMGMLDKPQDSGLQQFGQSNLNYLAGAAPGANDEMRTAASRLIEGQIGRASLPAYAQGNMVQAPSQNTLDLKDSFSRMINGDAGANPYLTGAIQGGIDQSTNQFHQMQGDATDNLMRNIMPSIRSNAVLAGQYGGSRQGVAEGNAIGDFTRQQAQAQTQFGQNNTNQAVGAQAQSYNQGQDRALSAMQGLSAQQYGKAAQDAATRNAAEFMNVNNAFDTSKFNAGADLAGVQAGSSILGGLTGNAYNVGANQDNYGLNQAGKVNGLLQPYLGMGGSSTTSQPLYENQPGNILGGVLNGMEMGDKVWGKLGGLFKPANGGVVKNDLY